FGFRGHGNSGPPDELIGVVHRQQRVVAVVLDALWAARPLRLTGVAREVPEAGDRTSRSADFFEPMAGVGAESSDIVDTLAVRVSFTGGTPVLRRFLARLDAVACPLLVRGIEVRPAAADGAAGGGLRSLEQLFGETETEEA